MLVVLPARTTSRSAPSSVQPGSGLALPAACALVAAPASRTARMDSLVFMWGPIACHGPDWTCDQATEACARANLPVVTMTCVIVKEVGETSVMGLGQCGPSREVPARGNAFIRSRTMALDGHMSGNPQSRFQCKKAAQRPPFVWSSRRLLHAVGDATLGQVVWSHLDLDAIAGQDADVVLAHATGDVGDDLVPILQADPEGGVRQRLDDGAFKLDGIVFRHAFPMCAVRGQGVKGGNLTREGSRAQKRSFSRLAKTPAGPRNARSMDPPARARQPVPPLPGRTPGVASARLPARPGAGSPPGRPAVASPRRAAAGRGRRWRPWSRPIPR